MNQFDNTVVIVTGAGTGIGRAIAVDFVKAGARVAFIGRRMEKLTEAATGLPEEQVLCYSCDVADRPAVEAMVAQVVGRFGPVNILVNNAGTNTSPRSVAETDPEAWNRILDINLTGAFNCVQTVLPGMRAQKGGFIINISSISGIRAGKLGGVAYSASKYGMMALNHCINEEENEHGIRACAICPGEVETPIIDMRPNPVSAEHRARMLQPKDISAAALFVAGLPPRTCVLELVIKPTSQAF